MPSVAHIVHRRRKRRARRLAIRRANRRWNGLILFVLVLLIVLPVTVVLGGAGLLYAQATAYLPTPGQTTYIDPIIGPTELYDRSGQTLLFSVSDPLGDQRNWVSLDDLPPYVIDATLLMEDVDFLEAATFNVGQTLNRLWRYMLDLEMPTDYSITGRLVRDTIVPQLRAGGLDSHLLEIALTAEVNRLYAPRAVLEWHLNTRYYGHDAYGIDAAAQVYLGKRAADLSLHEAALLAAVPPEPQYNPFDNAEAASVRQETLLRDLYLKGYVTEAAYNTAMTSEVVIRTDQAQLPQVAPDFSNYARRQAEIILDSLGLDGARLVSRGGLRITTSLDLDLYYQSECVLRTHLGRLQNQPTNDLTLNGQPCTGADYLPPPGFLNEQTPPDQGALVLIDVKTGEIRSLVGAAAQPIYQPGPTLQPFVYLEGFISTLFTPATMVLDVPQAFPGPADGLIYTPSNPDGRFRGPVNLRDAMSSWLLPPAVSVADNRGVNRVLRTAHQLGLNSLDENRFDLSVLERGGAVSVLDVAYAYSVFASNGIMQGINVSPLAAGFRARDPVAILQIENAEGQILWSYDEDAVALSRTIIL